MAWFILVPDDMYFKFYRMLWKYNKKDCAVCIDRKMSHRKYVTMFIGKFEISFAELIEKSLPGVTCLIMGPAELWKRALCYEPRQNYRLYNGGDRHE